MASSVTKCYYKRQKHIPDHKCGQKITNFKNVAELICKRWILTRTGSLSGFNFAIHTAKMDHKHGKKELDQYFSLYGPHTSSITHTNIYISSQQNYFFVFCLLPPFCRFVLNLILEKFTLIRRHLIFCDTCDKIETYYYLMAELLRSKRDLADT